MSSRAVIKVKSIGKCYQIYSCSEDRLRQSIYPKLQKLSGNQPKQYYQEFWALNNISFEIKKGETVGIIGRNGSGKSTLLQLICGTLNPTIGEIEVIGRVAALLELGSGFNPEFTGRENVYLNATLLGLSKSEIDKKFQQIVDFAEIGEFINQATKTYSSGMLVRLAFAVIAHVDADILIIDEALAVGDAFFTQKCMRFLRDFQDDGTILFVSHDANSIKSLCNRAIWINKGEKIAEGSPKEITEMYLEAFYGNQQDISSHANKNIKPTISTQSTYKDQREDFIRNSSLRNDLYIFEFNPRADSFGDGMAKIIDVRLVDNDGKSYSWIVGGELVRLQVACHIDGDINSPIVGFFIKDRLGQNLFGDNTYLNYVDSPLGCKKGNTLIAEFSFYMPILPIGEYSIAVAIASGSQEVHRQHHWVHDAIAFKSTASSVSTGLVGIPMRKIEMSLIDGY